MRWKRFQYLVKTLDTLLRLRTYLHVCINNFSVYLYKCVVMLSIDPDAMKNIAELCLLSPISDYNFSIIKR